MSRQIVQINTCTIPDGAFDHDAHTVVTTALLTDGTLWRTDTTTEDWHQLSSPPGVPRIEEGS